MTGARLALASVACLLAGTGAAWAGEGSTGEVAGGPMPSYDLFHPAPADKLRDFNPDRPSRFTGPFTVASTPTTFGHLLADIRNGRASMSTSGTPPRSTCASV